MTIEEFAEILGTSISIKRPVGTPTRGTWKAQLYGVEYKDYEADSGLKGINGWGSTPQGALSSLAVSIRGKIAVFHAYKDDRRTLGVPKTISV